MTPRPATLPHPHPHPKSHPSRIALFANVLETLGGGERYALALAQALTTASQPQIQVDILHAGRVTEPEITHRLQFDLAALRHVQLRTVPVQDLIAVSKITREYDWLINCSNVFLYPQAQRSALAVFFPVVVDLTRSGTLRRLIGYALRPLHALLPPYWQNRMAALPTRQDIAALHAYDKIISITRYTQQWVQHLWHKDSDLLYPLVKPVAPTQPKRNHIIHVGRFFNRAGHSKKQDVLIKAFRDMVAAGLTDWHLHLVGGLVDTPANRTYFAMLQDLTRDYPITLHPNLPHAALAALLGQARLYWHASGYGENLQRSPDRAEHFGISTVEAMSAGCVPLAFNAGGQPEIIEHGKSGWLWNTLGELQTQTLQLARQPDKLSALAEQARARSRIFCDEAAFNQRVLALLGMG